MYNHNSSSDAPIDVSRIKLMPGSGKLVTGIILLIFASFIELGIFTVADQDRVPAAISINIFFVLPLAFIGGMSVYMHFTYKKAIIKAIDKYGEKNILENVKNNTILTYKELRSHNATYFTDKFIVAPGTGIITYDEISQIYKETNQTKHGEITYLAFNLLTNIHYSLCKYISDSEIEEYVSICMSFNPNILIGHTKENNELHESRVKQHQNLTH